MIEKRENIGDLSVFNFNSWNESPLEKQAKEKEEEYFLNFDLKNRFFLKTECQLSADGIFCYAKVERYTEENEMVWGYTTEPMTLSQIEKFLRDCRSIFPKGIRKCLGIKINQYSIIHFEHPIIGSPFIK